MKYNPKLRDNYVSVNVSVLANVLQKSKSRFGISVLKILGAPIFRESGQLWVFGPNFAHKWILGSEFQKSKSGFGTNTFKIPCVTMFSQNGQLLIFRPKFGEIAQLHAIFWFKYCWGCCRELGGGWNVLGGGGWSYLEVEMSWMEVDRGGWSRMEVSARFSNTRKVSLYINLFSY